MKLRTLVAVAFVVMALPAMATGALHGKEVTLKSADGVTLYADIHEGPSSEVVVLLFHQGGGSARGEYPPIIPKLLSAGYTVVASDQRSGGAVFEVPNRTAQLLGKSAHYCEAYPDMEAVLAHARKSWPSAKIVVWGSSYSAALVMKLAIDHDDEITGVLAFSPASGDAMKGCGAGAFAADVKLPVLALRPKGEAEREPVQAQLAEFDELGFQTYVSDPGTHGSSMLVPDRAGGATDATWKVVMGFIKKVTK